MNDDLINKLKYISNNPLINGEYDEENYLFDDEAKILLYYITNLQEKVNQYENPDDLTLFYMWLDEKAKDKIKQLQEENETLKIEKQEEYNRFNLMAKFKDKALARELIYKSRNEKAIEYINNWLFEAGGNGACMDYGDIAEMKKILQGEDKDE